MWNRHQHSDAAQRGRVVSEDNDDNLESTEAIPEEITHESTYSMDFRKKRASGDDPDGASIGDADANRVDVVEGRRLPSSPSEVTAQLVLTLRNIRSLNAKCFFCKKFECDQVFVAKSLIPGKTRAYAVHSICVFDHSQLQDLPSESL
jgi:hypothetical protein